MFQRLDVTSADGNVRESCERFGVERLHTPRALVLHNGSEHTPRRGKLLGLVIGFAKKKERFGVYRIVISVFLDNLAKNDTCPVEISCEK